MFRFVDLKFKSILFAPLIAGMTTLCYMHVHLDINISNALVMIVR